MRLCVVDRSCSEVFRISRLESQILNSNFVSFVVCSLLVLVGGGMWSWDSVGKGGGEMMGGRAGVRVNTKWYVWKGFCVVLPFVFRHVLFKRHLIGPPPSAPQATSKHTVQFTHNKGRSLHNIRCVIVLFRLVLCWDRLFKSSSICPTKPPGLGLGKG